MDVKRLTISLAAAGLTAVALTACETSAAPTAVPPTSAAPAVASSTAAPSQDCQTQLSAWRGSGAPQLQSVADDLTKVGNDGVSLAAALQSGNETAAESALQTNAATMQSDIQAVQSNLPPSCVPGLRADVSAAMTNLNTEAIDQGQAATAAANGNYDLADGNVQAGNTAMSAGIAKLKVANDDMTAFSNGSGS